VLLDAAVVDGVRTKSSLSVLPTCLRNTWRAWTEEVLQWYRKFPVVPVECQGSRASVPASVVPGHILTCTAHERDRKCATSVSHFPSVLKVRRVGDVRTAACVGHCRGVSTQV